MKNLKFKLIPSILIVMGLIFVGSCNKKNNDEPRIIENQSKIDEITISDDFEWKTAKNVTFNISAASAQVITISSLDQEIRYHRGMFDGTNTYKITLSIPTTVNSVLVNGQAVNINSKNVSIELTETSLKEVMVDTDGDGIADNLDDFPNIPNQSFENNNPASTSGSLGFEDLWPGKGDFDFNDIVVDYQFSSIANAQNKVIEITATFLVKASGAYLHNGFGFNLPDANPTLITHLNVSGYNLQEGYISLNSNGLENGQQHPTIIVFDDVFNLLPHPQVGIGVNTEEWTPFVPYYTVTIVMTPTSQNYTLSDFSLETWNPFIIVDGERGKEVHLPDYLPTNLVNPSYFGTWDDDTQPGFGKYYKTTNNLPWAINIAEPFDWPREKIEINWAYLHFIEWAESTGAVYSDWYKDIFGYRNDGNLYHPNIP